MTQKAREAFFKATKYQLEADKCQGAFKNWKMRCSKVAFEEMDSFDTKAKNIEHNAQSAMKLLGSMIKIG
jgi:hypothetical protein